MKLAGPTHHLVFPHAGDLRPCQVTVQVCFSLRFPCWILAIIIIVECTKLARLELRAAASK
jgi:hypothetical protein